MKEPTTSEPLFDPEELAELFKKAKSYRRYVLVFRNGQPEFQRDEFDIIFEEALDAAFGPSSSHDER